MIKISVIIPAYNVGGYIQRAVNSVISQDITEIEVIVVNDGSTDDTMKEVEEICNEDSRVKLVNVSNGGVSRARNIGMEMAMGEYTLFLDSDDWLVDGSLNYLYNMAKKEDLDTVIFDYYIVNGKKITEAKSIDCDEIVSGDVILKGVLSNSIIPAVWNKFIKTSIVKNNVRFEENISIGEDLIFSIKLFTYALKVGKSTRCFYNYFIRENSLTNKVSDKIIQINYAITIIEKFLLEKNIMEENYLEFEFLEYMHLYFYRVVVGNMSDEIHRTFYSSYDKTEKIYSNEYYKSFVSKSSFSVKIMLCLYNLNYSIARRIHKCVIGMNR